MTTGRAPDPLPDFDLYGELGITLDATTEVIEQAWRAKVRGAHPDRASGSDEAGATWRTARLNIAREWLTDPTRRARYDALRLPLGSAGSSVDVSGIDPLGDWARPARPTRTSVVIAPGRRYVLVPLAVMIAMTVVGIGTNLVTIVAFDLALVAFLYFGLFWLVGALYRMVIRWATRRGRVRS
ncbi:MAG: DnaJ domain-containing protein [Chloroflexota bacterium]